MFTYFVQNGQDGLHLAWSRDGYKWEALNDGRTYLTPTVGREKLVRDPCVVKGPDGVYHMVWTCGWHEKSFGHASSRDLKKWENVTAKASFPNEGTGQRMRHGTIIEVPLSLIEKLRVTRVEIGPAQPLLS